MEETKRLSIILSLGKNRLFIYSAIASISTNGVLEITQSNLAKSIGVSDKFLKQNTEELSEMGLLEIEKSGRRYKYTIAPLDAANVKVTTESVSRAIKVSKAKEMSPTHTIFNYFTDKYFERYGVSYKVGNHARERSQIKSLCVKYDNDVEMLKSIIDVVMRLFDAKWKQTNFPRPTIGQLVSWLARQAEPFATANLEADSQIEITVEGSLDDMDVLDVFDAKWGV